MILEPKDNYPDLSTYISATFPQNPVTNNITFEHGTKIDNLFTQVFDIPKGSCIELDVYNLRRLDIFIMDIYPKKLFIAFICDKSFNTSDFFVDSDGNNQKRLNILRAMKWNYIENKPIEMINYYNTKVVFIPHDKDLTQSHSAFQIGRQTMKAYNDFIATLKFDIDPENQDHSPLFISNSNVSTDGFYYGCSYATYLDSKKFLKSQLKFNTKDQRKGELSCSKQSQIKLTLLCPNARDVSPESPLLSIGNQFSYLLSIIPTNICTTNFMIKSIFDLAKIFNMNIKVLDKNLLRINQFYGLLSICDESSCNPSLVQIEYGSKMNEVINLRDIEGIDYYHWFRYFKPSWAI